MRRREATGVNPVVSSVPNRPLNNRAIFAAAF
jgi:hypothetical protein